MSTKIYEAYEYKGGLEPLLKALGRVRERVVSTAVSSCLRAIIKPENFSYFEYADALKKAMRSGTWEIVDDKCGVVDNHHSSAVVYFRKGRIFVQFFGLPRDFKIGIRGLRDFHYQNQTDPWYTDSEYAKRPMSWHKAMHADWNDRRRTWDAIIRKDGRPSHSGLIFPFIEESDSIRLASAVYEKMHGHGMWTNDAVEKSKTCEICVKRRAAAAAEDAKKKDSEAAPK